MRVIWFWTVLWLCTNSLATANDLRGPDLGVASNFGQGVPPGLLDAALSAGFLDYRDAVYWERIETLNGVFQFNSPMTLFPDALHAAGARMSLTVNNGRPAYDNGFTPTSREAIDGFGRYVAAVVDRFPAVQAIEIGNEFNSANFVSGPLRSQGLQARADAYARLVRSVRKHVADRGQTIISGGVHSVPTGYLKRLTNSGAIGLGEHIAVHPYDTPIEQLGPQLRAMRQNQVLEETPVQITEFGSQNEDEAPHILFRSYCAMALSGVRRAVWYPLNQRGDGYTPLIANDLRLTKVGKSAQFVTDHLVGKTVQDVSPDPFTFGCLLDERHLIVWGAPRDVTITSQAVNVLLPAQDDTSGPLRLSETRALVVTSDQPLALGRDVVLGAQKRIADSFYQFPLLTNGTSGPFTILAESNSRTKILNQMPGQSGPGVPWTPYLGHPSNKDVRVLSNTLLPAAGAAFSEDVIVRFTAKGARESHLHLLLRLPDRSIDSVGVELRLNGQSLWNLDVKRTLELSEFPLSLAAGDILDTIVSAGETATGDVVSYRIRLETPP